MDVPSVVCGCRSYASRVAGAVVEPKSGSAAGEGEYLHTTLSACSLQHDIVPALRRRLNHLCTRHHYLNFETNDSLGRAVRVYERKFEDPQ